MARSGNGRRLRGGPAGWQRARDNEVSNLASLQRGARNFMNYCSGCHSLKYVRYSRLAADLGISEQQVDRQPDVHRATRIARLHQAGMPPRMPQDWFGKAPPDLSLIARVAGRDWIYKFLKSFYADPEPADRREQPAAAGHGDAARAVRAAGRAGSRLTKRERRASGKPSTKHFKEFEPGAAGSLTPEQYDEFVRDTVNFLDYVGDPTQLERQGSASGLSCSCCVSRGSPIC